MKREQYQLKELKGSLARLEAEARRFKTLARNIPAIEKNVDPILAFIDILSFHLCEIENSRLT